MCGITGIYGVHGPVRITEAVLEKMTGMLHHRGPDDVSYYYGNGVGLGFKRLSIIDVHHGRQPFISEDKQVALICNGEIYNHRELRRELEQKGYRFTTHCDVEVILYLYLQYGHDFIDRLNGQFAFCIFDGRNRSVFLARDQFGICPLFYTQVKDTFVFGSEIKAILQHPEVKRDVNLEGLDQVFSFPGLVSPATMFKDICSLPPGHYLLIEDGKTSITQYWDLIYPEQQATTHASESYYREKLEELLIRAVKYRMNADVPIGFYLSGGLDSSLVGGIMKAVAPDGGYPAFSIGFPGNNDMNESTYQQQVAKHLGVTMHEILFDPSEVESRLKSAVWSSECALKESYNTCSLALSQAVNQKGIRVVLSGEGADELFGGYVGYKFDKQRVINTGNKELEEQLEDEYRFKLWGDKDFFYEKNYYEFSDTKRNIYSRTLRERFRSFDAVSTLQFNKERVRNRHVLHKRSYIDLKLRLSDHLIADHCDRMTYANSVEGRFPFLDIDLVEFARTIPPDLKLNGLNEKYILKEIARKYIPGQIIDRQKFGFIAPGSPDLIRQRIEWIDDMLSYERIKKQGYFDPDTVEALRKIYSASDFRLNLPYESDLLIVVLTFNILLELFDLPNIH
ncbi:asparagine synthase (glutamine-hydrolyzing) [Chitinophaga sp. G-6-1-13]|uniref:asparagine synthase (glutamine-hydrolyzing) n=1 Tax=Chitinophaga fulva TaxID=2728842 RepID=A0A848GKC8_9BACT|nr:asparagine synthase (glutamine-hydrolyzing) [Chitinophaga fulva]NML37859.1 asparagine synthase (glutamine-hydrolyzing) [Chitinophaga fulva]